MRYFYFHFSKSLAVVVVAVCLQAGFVEGRGQNQDDSFMRPINLQKNVMTIHQVIFDLDAGIARGTDWGRVQFDSVMWGKVTGMKSGYINMFVHSQGRQSTVSWVVQNLFMPAQNVKHCPPTPANNAGLSRGPGSARPNPRPVTISAAKRSTPMSVYFDLRPDIDGSGPVDSIMVCVVVSKQALPVVNRIMEIAGGFSPMKVDVTPAIVNAEGDLGDSTSTISGGGEDDPDMVGPPPLPPDPGPGPIDNLAFPIAIYQNNQRNTECADNQCVPMAYANVLQYLEDRYHKPPLVWFLPQQPIPGIGKTITQGQNSPVFWEPEPEISLVANIDSRTKRLGVFDFNTGDGTNKCQQIRGAFGYMATFGNLAKVKFRHQGGVDPVYGDSTVCDDDELVDLGGLVTSTEGANPTWDWIFEQLTLGRGVSMSFGRYNSKGERKSGHMLRVWGAMRFDGIDYLYTLDDSVQGYPSQGGKNTGLQIEQWEVADTAGPGDPGNPDGRLNMNGSTWEIEFAISAEAKPTLVIP